MKLWASQVVLMVRNQLANTGDLIEAGGSLGCKDTLEEEMAPHFRTLMLKNPMDRGAW